MAVSITTGAGALSGGDAEENEVAMARELAERLNAAGRRSTAELLLALRQTFPKSPLSVRVAALKALSLR